MSRVIKHVHGTGMAIRDTGLPMAETLEYWIDDTSIVDHGDKNVEGSFAYFVEHLNTRPTNVQRQAKFVFGPGRFNLSSLVYNHNDIFIAGSGRDITQLVLSLTGGIHIRRGEAFVPSSTYSVGQQVIPSAAYGAFPTDVAFYCITAGVAGSSEPSWNLTVNAVTTTGGASFITVDPPNFDLRDFSIEQSTNKTGAALYFYACNHGAIDYIKVTGGNTTTPNDGIVFDSCNQISLGNHVSFPGIYSHGLACIMSNVVTFPYNFGDLTSGRIDIKFNGTGQYGIMIKGHPTTKFVNNCSFLSVNISGTGLVADVNIPILLWSAKRIKFEHADIEACTVGLVEISDGTNLCEYNGFGSYIFLPGTAQSGEAVFRTKGIPFAVQSDAPFSTVVVRDKWLDFPAFAWTNSQPTYLRQQDSGQYSRVLAASGAVQRNTPAGFTTFTLASTVPTEMRSSLARRPEINNTGNISVGGYASMLNGNASETGVTYLQGQWVKMGEKSSLNYESLTFGQPVKDEMVWRPIANVADGFKLKAPVGGACAIAPELAAGFMTVERRKKQRYTVAGLPAAAGNTDMHVIVTNDAVVGVVEVYSDGTNWRKLGIAGNPIVS